MSRPGRKLMDAMERQGLTIDEICQMYTRACRITTDTSQWATPKMAMVASMRVKAMQSLIETFDRLQKSASLDTLGDLEELGDEEMNAMAEFEGLEVDLGYGEEETAGAEASPFNPGAEGDSAGVVEAEEGEPETL